MRLSRSATALLAALVVTVGVVVLLTPVGFETRPTSALEPVGYVAIGSIFLGLGLFLTSVVTLFRRARLASGLAIVGSIVFFFPVIGDQLGYFFSKPIPPAVRVLEYILVAVLLLNLALAGMVLSERRSGAHGCA